MPRLQLINGLPGSGKSTLGAEFVEVVLAEAPGDVERTYRVVVDCF